MEQKGFVHIIIIVLVLILASGGIFYLSVYRKEIPSPTPNPTSTNDPTISWKSFSDTATTLGISFKYPASWTLSAPDETSETHNSVNLKEKPDVHFLHSLSIMSYGKTDENNLEQHKKGTDNWGWEDGPFVDAITIDNTTAWMKHGQMMGTDNVLHYRKYILVVSATGTLYEISWWDDPDKTYDSIFNQILSTIKFLE